MLFSIQYICFQKTSVSNMGRQTCFFPWATSNLGTPLSAVHILYILLIVDVMIAVAHANITDTGFFKMF